MENAADKELHGTHLHGEDSPISKLKNDEVLRIFSDDRYYSEIAKDYNVSEGTVYAIKRGRTWAHITGMEMLHDKLGRRRLKLSEAQVIAIKIRIAAGERNHVLAKEYDVSFQCISKIKMGTRWGWLKAPSTR